MSQSARWPTARSRRVDERAAARARSAVSLEVSATPQAGVHIHISNPIATDATETQRAHGAGLPGLAARVHSVNGQCR